MWTFKDCKEHRAQYRIQRAKYGFDCDTCAVISSIDEQSSDIAMGVNKSLECRLGECDGFDIGAGDQGMVFGFACDETEELMPLLFHWPISLQSSLRQYGRKKLSIIFARRQTQVTVEYDGFNPVRVDTVVVSSQHSEDVTMERIESDLKELVIKKLFPHLLDDKTNTI